MDQRCTKRSLLVDEQGGPLAAVIDGANALLVRSGKHWFNHLGPIQLACALLWYRHAHRLNAE